MLYKVIKFPLSRVILTTVYGHISSNDTGQNNLFLTKTFLHFKQTLTLPVKLALGQIEYSCSK